ncbi:hypothetical protein BDV96DRAFT_596693 [Lophiotrema nucula]|uniref:Uncharacterized protein n=1 Tax=Lophiotrema nucula TaxID=690887 RepID=A0A6A5ZH62_9PLEO|nr:hypothetical protein BDV96DRAFT_596693 [Lophiotrema nucula]
MSEALSARDMAKLTALVNLVALRHEGQMPGLIREPNEAQMYDTSDAEENSGSLGPVAENNLRQRFLEGLAEMISNHSAWNTPTTVVMQEDKEHGTVDIYVVGVNRPGLNQGEQHAECTELFKALEISLGALQPSSTIELDHINRHRDQPRQSLWDFSIDCYKSEVHRSMEELEETLDEYNEAYEDIVSDMFGLFDEVPQQRDAEMAQVLPKLHGHSCPFAQGGGDRLAQERLLFFAFDTLRVPNMDMRLKRTLGSMFGSKVLRILHQLGRPRAAYHTIVRTAQSLSAFGTTRIHYDISSLDLSFLPGRSMDLRDAFRAARLPFDLPSFNFHIGTRASFNEAINDFFQLQQHSTPIHVELQLLLHLAFDGSFTPFPYIGRSANCKLYGFLFYGLQDYFSTRGYVRKGPTRWPRLNIVDNSCPDVLLQYEKCLGHHLRHKPLETLLQLVGWQPRLTQLMALITSATRSKADHRNVTVLTKYSSSSTSSISISSPASNTSVPIKQPPQKTASHETKSKCALFLSDLMEGLNPHPASNSYLTFGYVACEGEDEHQRLGGIFKELLVDSTDRVGTFNDFCLALEQGTMVQFLDNNGYELFREAIPRLEEFFTTPSASRPTVWRLIQFLRNENATDPDPYMMRDYGFNLCKQRDQVLRLKNVYAQVLQKIDPMKLHYACVEGRLNQLRVEHRIYIEEEDMRFLQNWHAQPGLGREGEDGIRLFKNKWGFGRRGN